MSTPRERWLAARMVARRGRPSPVIGSCELLARPDGRFDVVIRGRDLRSGAIPSQIRVGGRSVREVRGEEGTVLRGVVDDGRPDDDVTVDLGPFGRAEGKVETVG